MPGDKRSKVADGAVHWNDNIVCSIDVETTGLDPEFHELIEIAIVPLTQWYDVNNNFPIFTMTVAPRKPVSQISPEAMNINQLDLAKIINGSVPSASAVDLFIHWFEGLKLKEGKQIEPLGCNWPFDREFIIDWMGRAHFNHYFSRYFRDVQPVAKFMADRDGIGDNRIFFPKIGLKSLCSTLGVENPQPHRALGDAVATARCYAKMLRIAT